MSVTQCCACLLPIESGETHSLIGCAGGHRIHKDCLRDWQRTDCARGLRCRARSDAALSGGGRQAVPCPTCCINEKGFGHLAIGSDDDDVDDDYGGGGGGGGEEEEGEEGEEVGGEEKPAKRARFSFTQQLPEPARRAAGVIASSAGGACGAVWAWGSAHLASLSGACSRPALPPPPCLEAAAAFARAEEEAPVTGAEGHGGEARKAPDRKRQRDYTGPLGPFEQPRTPLGRALLADAKAAGVEPLRSAISNTGYVGVHFDGTRYRVYTRGAFTSVHGATYRTAEHIKTKRFSNIGLICAACACYEA